MIPSISFPYGLSDLVSAVGEMFSDVWPLLAFTLSISIGFGVLMLAKGLFTRRGSKIRLR